MQKVWIYLENGTFLEANSFGASGTSVGEIVFNTSLTGYQEITTDPSYAGQFVTFTMPEIGIVGVNEDDNESSGVHCKGIIVRSYNKNHSNYRAQSSLATLLEENNTLGICDIENTLSIYNSKTCDIEKFKKYIEEKNKVNNNLFNLYEDEKFRQYKWYAYINKKRCEDNMLNLIENKFGKDVKVIMGDWSIKKQMRNFISTPNLGIKRKLNERFDIFNNRVYFPLF